VIFMTIQILPPDEAAKKAKERVAEWKRQREIDAAKARIEAKKEKEEKISAQERKAEPKIEKKSASKGTTPTPKKQKELDSQLFEAAENGDTKKAKELLDKGADINATNNRGATVLMIAAGRDVIEITKMLIERGADVNAKTKDGSTALMSAAHNDRYEQAKLLIERGADVNTKAENGLTALKIAHRGQYNIDDLLRKHGATE